MFIKKIQMKGYKRFHDLTIDLGESPKRIVALVGPNGCGKSSVFDAMIFLAKAYMAKIGDTKVQRDYHYHSLEQMPHYDYSNIEVEFVQGSYHIVYNRMKELGTERSIFSFRSSFRYNADLNHRRVHSPMLAS